MYDHHGHPPAELFRKRGLSASDSNATASSARLLAATLSSVSVNGIAPGTSYKWNQTVLVISRLASFTQHRILRSIHVAACVRMSFPLKAGQYALAWIMTHCIYCIYPSSRDGHLGCFPLLATWNSAAINTDEQISFQVLAFNSFGSIPRNGIAVSCGNSIFDFLSNCQTVFHSSYTILHAGQQCKVPISIRLCQHLRACWLVVCLLVLDSSHSNGCEVV